MPQPTPQLIFFVELYADALVELLEQPAVVDLLATRGYGLSMAMLDWSPERADLVRMLNQRDIPITARLLLPKDAGYWFNVENYPQAVAQYRTFRQWALAEGLRFAAVGLDMEPPTHQRRALGSANPLAIYRAITSARSNALFPAAQEAYHDLVANIRVDGYAVHAYQYPFVVDDRRAGTTLAQRALNVVALPSDLEVLCCYSSLVPRINAAIDLGTALIAEYGIYADSIGVGSTGGGIVVDPATGARAARLSWRALARDLQLAAQYTDTIHVFSLEGCVEAGYLEPLSGLDWSAAPALSIPERLLGRLLRFSIGVILWWSRAGLTFMGWLGWVVVGAMLLRRGVQRLRRSD